MRRALSTRLLLAAALLATSTRRALAEPSSCDANGGQFCDLPKYLHGLYAIAAILTVILVVVLIGAVLYYRKARKMRLEP